MKPALAAAPESTAMMPPTPASILNTQEILPVTSFYRVLTLLVTPFFPAPLFAHGASVLLSC